MHFTPPIENDLQIPSSQLDSEIRRLIMFSTTKKKNAETKQAKAELALLLHEAHRTTAFKEWDFRTLGAYAKAVGLSPDLFNKYKSAGRELQEYFSDLAARWFAAVRDSQPRPRLPEVSELAMLPSVRKQLGPEAARQRAREILEGYVPLRHMRINMAEESYGASDSRGKRTLSALDDFLVRAEKLEEMLDDVLRGRAGTIPDPLLHQRASTALALLERIGKQAAEIKSGTLAGDPRRAAL